MLGRESKTKAIVSHRRVFSFCFCLWLPVASSRCDELSQEKEIPAESMAMQIGLKSKERKERGQGMGREILR